jgi:hypothetical protein
MGIAVIVDWYGPYTSKDKLKDEMRCWSKGAKALYMGIKKRNIVNYIGLTSDPQSRMNNHEKLAHVDNVKFFCGQIVSQGVGGRRATKCKTDLKLAEHALIARLNPDQNSSLVRRDLEDCVVVYSRFFDAKDGETPIDPLPKFPKVIAYNWWRGEWDM